MNGSVRAAGQARVLSVAAAVVVLLLLLMRLARDVGQHEILRERGRFTEIIRIGQVTGKIEFSFQHV